MLSCALAMAAILLLAVPASAPALSSDITLRWWHVLVFTVVGDLLAFRLPHRDGVCVYTLSEVGLVVSLLFATPRALLAGRLLGSLLTLVLWERQRLTKLCVNVACVLTECAIALSLVRVAGADGDVLDPRTWTACFAAVAVASSAGFVVLAVVVRWHGGMVDPRAFCQIAGVTVPLNTALGLVCAILLATDPWTCLPLAVVVGFTVLGYRAHYVTRRHNEVLLLLSRLNSDAIATQSPERTMLELLANARVLFSAKHAVLWTSRGASGGHLLATGPDGPEDGGRAQTVSLADVSSWFDDVEIGTPIRSARADRHESASLDALGARSCLVAPLTEQGRVVGFIGMLDVISARARRFGRREVPLFAAFARHMSASLEHSELIRRLHARIQEHQHTALHDSLTGLPNRLLFADRLHSAVETGARSACAVALLDLNGFKLVNDSLGHRAGDDVLREVARRLTSVCTPRVLVARLGGDEFALLFPAGVTREMVECVAHAVRDAVAEPITTWAGPVRVGISVGVALSPDASAGDPSSLLHLADLAMYRAKHQSSDGIAIHSPC